LPFGRRHLQANTPCKHLVDRARRRNADVSYEGGATIAIASHPAALVVHVYRRNSIKTDSLSNEKRGHSVENEQHAPQDRHVAELSSAGFDIKTVILS
jgi:hypothetical protein